MSEVARSGPEKCLQRVLIATLLSLPACLDAGSPSTATEADNATDGTETDDPNKSMETEGGECDVENLNLKYCLEK